MPPKKRNREDESVVTTDGQQQHPNGESATDQSTTTILKTEGATTSSGDLVEVKDMLKNALKRNVELEQEKNQLVREHAEKQTLLLLELNFSVFRGFDPRVDDWEMLKNPYAYPALMSQTCLSLEPSDLVVRIISVSTYTELLKLMRNPTELEGYDLKSRTEAFLGNCYDENFHGAVLVNEEANIKCVFACYLRRNAYFKLALSHSFDPVGKKWNLDPMWENGLLRWWCQPQYPYKEITGVSIDLAFIEGEPFLHSDLETSNVSSGMNLFWEDHATFVRLYPSGSLFFNDAGKRYSLDPANFLCKECQNGAVSVDVDEFNVQYLNFV